ncbi:cysteine hydrolase [filamentous cyanobacterium LEGE 11480]|uniref:Cysteine hydrolase n=1 Tax=Romeriopsis navalis LEGE 11480 TaxID=2777977 RepID=A0A928VH62_9CYAN|nr:cysteine hydrolase [Romeriopsis navalis]MBE9028536.1 cysteine hydrolase [Romeriopsis navalis LEGE 11480]
METAFGLNIPETLEDACTVDRTALIVYDMQIGILSQLQHGEAIKAQVIQVVEAARSVGLRTFFMRHMSLPKELSGVFQLKMAKAWQRAATVDQVNPWFLPTAPGFQLIPELTPLSSEAVFDKITMSAFEGTPLNIALRDCGIDTVIIVGVATEIGIEPTVRHAADLGYIPIVITDACGAGDAAAGERAIASLRFMGDAFFSTVEEICQILHQPQNSASSH